MSQVSKHSVPSLNINRIKFINDTFERILAIK